MVSQKEVGAAETNSLRNYVDERFERPQFMVTLNINQIFKLRASEIIVLQREKTKIKRKNPNTILFPHSRDTPNDQQNMYILKKIANILFCFDFLNGKLSIEDICVCSAMTRMASCNKD
jgi:hypothetical protein